MAACSQSQGKNRCAILWASLRDEIASQVFRLAILVRQPERSPYNSRYENLWRIQIGRGVFLRRIARRRSAPAGAALLDSGCADRRSTPTREFTNRYSYRAVKIDRSRVELCGSHRRDETR